MMIDVPVVSGHMAILEHDEHNVAVFNCECGWFSLAGTTDAVMTAYAAHVRRNA